jgi:hypothetical protein
MRRENSKPSRHSDSSFLWNLHAATVIGGFFGVEPISFEAVSSTLVGWVWTLMAASFFVWWNSPSLRASSGKTLSILSPSLGVGRRALVGLHLPYISTLKTRGAVRPYTGRGMRLALHPVVVVEANSLTRRLPLARRIGPVARSRRVQPVRNDQRYVSSLQHANPRRCLWLRVSPQGSRRLLVQRPAY